MIKNTTVKKRRIFCALLVIAIFSSVFACWASAAGEESGDSGANKGTEATQPIKETEEQAKDPALKSAAEDKTPVNVTATSTYDDKNKTITIKVSLINTAITDRVVNAVVSIDDQEYELSDIAVRAGNAYDIEYDIKNVEKDAQLPVVKVTGVYSDAMTSTKLGENGEIIYADVYELADGDKNRLDAVEITAGEAVANFVNQTGFVRLFTTDWKCLVMIGIACVLLFLAIVKGFEPLLLLPIAFGMLLTNLPGAEMFHEELWAGGHAHWNLFDASNSVAPGLLDYLYLGVKLGIYPCLIFFGVGAMTDFEPLIANPKSLLLGAAAQLGIFVTYVAAIFMGFNPLEAGSIGIIGGADGPTAIFVTSKLAPHLLGPIAVAAYSYMALVPVIQPPIMKALTTKKERCIKMQALRKVSKTEKIIFPIVVTVFVALLVPSAAPLVGSLMLGNLFKESGVTERLSKTVQNELMNIVTIFLGVTVGATATADTFLSVQTIKIIVMGVIAFGLGTAGGVLLCKFMNLFMKNKINPLCGSAGVSAVPMAARVSQMVGQKEDPSNFLLMHAMGPNVAGVIGSAIAAGVMIALFG